MLDLIIKNGQVIDGTGGPPQAFDLGIKNGVITEIGKLANTAAKKNYNADGAYIAPGFIDLQNHSDSFWTLFDYPHQESLLKQGITTIVTGHCGASLAPLPSLDALKSVQKWHSLEGVNFNWQYFEDYLATLSKQPLGVNVAGLVGHSTIRRGLLGDEVRKVTDQEYKTLERLTVSSLKSGAFGLSLGLVYSHEFDSSLEELAGLARIVKKFDRLLSVHIRNEESHILEALDEAVKLAADTGVRLKISHFKVRGQKNWHLFNEALLRLEQAYQKGVKINFDFYPYTTSWNVLYTYLPKWSTEGGRDGLMQRLKQPFLRKKILDNLIQSNNDFAHLVIATSSASPHLVGRKLSDIAADQGVSSEEAVLNVLASTEGEVVVFDENINPQHLTELIKHPLSIVATDGAGFDFEPAQNFRNLVHPRCFGAMPKFLSEALSGNLISVEQAIHKITGAPAAIAGLLKRGVIKKDNPADIVVFDKSKLSSPASLSSPFQAPTGIKLVVVSGRVSVEEGQMTGQFAGRVLKAH